MSIKIPADFPVQPTDEKGPNVMTCGACGLSWDDSIITEFTPTPGARCPFEWFHDQMAREIEYKGAIIEDYGDAAHWRLRNAQGKIYGGDANSVKHAKAQITRYLNRR